MRVLGSIFVSVILLFIVLMQVNVGAVFRQLTSLSLVTIIGTVIALDLCFAIGAARFTRAVERTGYGVSVKEFTLQIVPMTLFTLFLAHGFSLLSEAARIQYLSRSPRLSSTKKILIVLTDRTFGLATTLIVAGATLSIFDGVPMWVRAGALCVTLVGVLLLLASSLGWLRLPCLGDKARELSQVCGLFLPHVTAAVELLTIAVTSSAVFGVAMFLIACNIGAPLSLGTCLLAAPIICASLSVPFTFAGLGAREAAHFFLLAKTGLVAPEQALALSLALGACIFFSSLLGLIWALIWPADRVPHMSDRQQLAGISTQRAQERTIADFGEQWRHFTGNEGYYGSVDLLHDILGDLASPNEFRGREVLDVGSGSGRIVGMLIAAGARKVYAVEPSAAFETLTRNTESLGDHVMRYQVDGANIPQDLSVDSAVSIGVLHHIPDPRATVAAVYRSLKPGGVFFAWLYGREGNEIYLSVAAPLRMISKSLPHPLLTVLCGALTLVLDVYIAAAVVLPVPMRAYMRNVLAKLDRKKRYLVIYDQLRPFYAKYYTGSEAKRLFEEAGFEDVQLYHRHGYGWTVRARRGLST